MLRAALLFTLIAGPALACSPARMEPQRGPVQGQGCAVHYQITEYSRAGLTTAENLGAGMVWQRGFESEGCSSDNYGVVIDCTSGRAAIFGPDRVEIGQMPQNPGSRGFRRLEEAVRKAAAAGKPLAVEDIKAQGAAAGMKHNLTMALSQRLTLDDKRFDLNCACKLHYPGL